MARQKDIQDILFSGIRTVLVVSPHSDDADVGCGGTVAKLARAGKNVVYCIVTHGEKGMHKLKVSSAKLIAIRKKEQAQAVRELGVRRVVFLGESDGELENTKAVRKKIVRVVREVRPELVLSFDPAARRFDSGNRFHRDHRMCAEAVFDALYPAAGNKAFFPEFVRAGLRPHSIREAWFFGAEEPDLFIDVSDTMADKMKAARQHASQFENMNELERELRAHARATGKKIKAMHAEAFRRVCF